MMNSKVFVLLVVVLAALAVSVTAVKNLDFALEYRGKCDFSADKSSANCHLKAQSQEVLTHIKGDGNVATSVRKLIGSVSNLDFFTNYNFTSYSWTSKGSLSFGVHTTQKNHRLEFEDSSIGRINPYPYSYGFATSWKVTKGFGAFDQAVGLITANGVFDIDANGETKEVVVGVIGVIYYKGNSNSTLAAN
ncbi:uncharacterized protein ACA1_175220 [Acanthamoeba castellanii str. Neff]|uniref:Uncharacterized protein n=1 Tax=Acanthamoeba castellanii (strain ATCC 30010 / Neff) TaxID=1257118 RepID=L8HJI3_ACACF|nr:uncharacterized protein ACA1_175220 [Acanthamoeba castellanii str. Neff]ELR24848.1 hypothetical protein ACA1_175220 [Acanthamoeba castellanii str. Neff]